LNEALIVEVAAIFRELADLRHLKASLKRIETLDEFVQAALYEAVAFIARREVRCAREAIHHLDGPWIDLEHPEDLTILFDN
jgi:hypothetical protein